MTVMSTMRNTEITYGVVYKIIDNVNHDILYVGSTFNYSRRKQRHEKCFYNKNDKEYNKNLYVYVRTLENGYNNIKFKIIDFIETNDKKELEKYERSYIDCLMPFCNITKPNRTLKEYYNDNRELILEHKKKYYLENKESKIKEYYNVNKDKIYERRNKKHNCEICNGKYTLRGIARHNKSKKHINALSNQ